MVDVFGHGSNISLVYDFMDTDLEVNYSFVLFDQFYHQLHLEFLKKEIIKDRENIVLTPAHIKSYMVMILAGMEFLHANWILHRVLNILIFHFRFLFLTSKL